MAARPKAVAFDVIGTTFSLEPLRGELVRLGFPGHVLETWFARTLRDAFALAATQMFAPFRALFEANLDEIASPHAISLAPKQKDALIGQFAALPPHADAMQAIQRLKQADVRVFALSNGAAATSEKLLRNAGLINLIERVISVDDIKVFKPAPEIYLHAVQLAGLVPAEMALVATHAWDVHGAKNAGLMAGFVARGQKYPSIMHAPDVIGETLLDVAHTFAA